MHTVGILTSSQELIWFVHFLDKDFVYNDDTNYPSLDRTRDFYQPSEITNIIQESFDFYFSLPVQEKDFEIDEGSTTKKYNEGYWCDLIYKKTDPPNEIGLFTELMAKNYKCDQTNYKAPVELYFTMKQKIEETELKELFGDYKSNILNAKGTTV